MVGRMQDRTFPQTRQARSAHHRLAGRGHRRASGKAHCGSGGEMSTACFPARHALIPQRRYLRHAALAPCPMPVIHSRHAYPLGFRCDPLPLPIPSRHRHHAYPVSIGYRLAERRMRTRHLPNADIMRTGFRSDACPFVRRYLRGPAYVSYRRSASYSTAGEWLRPFEPRKTQRRERQ